MKSRDFYLEVLKSPKEDLKLKAQELSEELMRLRSRAVAGQLDKSSRITELRRNLARVNGLISKAQ